MDEKKNFVKAQNPAEKLLLSSALSALEVGGRKSGLIAA
jgi:hypothetical protein